MFYRVGSSFPQLFIACYDRYENKTTFPRIPPKISVKLHMGTAVESISRMKAELSSNKSILNIKVFSFPLSHERTLTYS